MGCTNQILNPVTPPGIDPETVRLVAQYLNHYAIPNGSITLQNSVANVTL